MASKILLLFIAFEFILNTFAVEKCYKPFGCYSLESPWWTLSRPFAVLPKAPEIVNTRFLLYTREDLEVETELLINKTGILELSDFDAEKNTKIIVHGFLHSVGEKWVTKMKSTLLKNEDCNLIFVEWGDGAGIPYMQACANARLVGDQLSHLLRFLQREAKMDLKRVHAIGQGLGAHVAGYAGKTTKVGRITALDPVGPYFSGPDTRVRLDKADADFVDVVHTDGNSLLVLGFGMDRAIGHVDFYPNNGKDQPGCGDLLDRLTGSVWDLMRLNTIGAREAVACSHRRAIDFFVESINTECPLIAFPCSSEADFKTGKCRSCAHGRCSRMGYNSDQHPGRGKMYLTTNSASPFCHYTFVTNVTVSQNQKATTGEIYGQVLGRSGKTDFARINNESLKVRSRDSYTTSLQSTVEISEVVGVRIKFDDKAFLFHQDLIVEKIVVSRLDAKLDTQNTYFCQKNTIVKNGATVELKKSSSFC